MLPSLSCILLTLHSGLNNLRFLYWKVIQNLFLFQLEPWCRQGLCGCTCHSLWGRWPKYTHWENRVLRLLDPGSHLRLYQWRVVFQPHCCQACCPGCTEAQEVQSYSFICEAYCSCQAYAGRWRGMPTTNKFISGKATRLSSWRFTGLSCCGTSSMMFMARSVLCPAQIRSRHEIVAPASV